MKTALRTVGLIILLSFMGCQPYIDHAEPIVDFRAGLVDFGTRRELKLLEFRHDDQALTLEFNQPLVRFEEIGEAAPFVPQFRPRVSVRSAIMTGVATVRLEFEGPLREGRQYTATLPSGWRALAGASFVTPQTLEWRTEQKQNPVVEPTDKPISLQLKKAEWRPERGVLSLSFSEAVLREELEAALKGVDRATVEVLTQDQLEYSIFIGRVSAPKKIAIKESLSSVSGAHLKQEFEYVLAPPESKRPDQEYRTPRQLSPGKSVLNIAVTEETQIATWQLDHKSAVEWVRLSSEKWNQPAKRSVELTKPLYSEEVRKPQPAVRFLPNQAKWNQERPDGLFLVRLSHKQKVRRYLVERSSGRFESWALNGQVNGVVLKANGDPLLGAEVLACDISGRAIARTRTDDDGQARFDSVLPQAEFLWVSGRLSPIGKTQVSPPLATPGIIWSQGVIHQPGAVCDVLGLWWAEKEMPAIELVDTKGESLAEVPPLTRSGPLFSAKVQLPETPGEYRLRWEGTESNPELSLVKSARVFVSEIALNAGRDLLTLEESEGKVKGEYSWEGRGSHLVGIRSFLHYPSSRTRGWDRVRPGQPRRLPLKVEQSESFTGGAYSVEVPTALNGSYQLVVELFDESHPSVVLATRTLDLGAETVSLQTADLRSVDPSTMLGRFQFRYLSESGNGARAMWCRLHQFKAGKWELVVSQEPEWKDGAYNLDLALASAGTYRLEVAETQQGAVLSTWQRTLHATGVKLSAERAVSGQSVEVSVPEFSRETGLWLAVLTLDSMTVFRRRSDGDGVLGEIVVPAAGLGQREAEIVVSNGEKLLTDRLRIDNSSLYSSSSAPLIELEGQRKLHPKETVTVEAPSEATLGVFWWSLEDGSKSRPSRLVELIEFTRAGQATAGLPTLGPRSFLGTEILSIDTPDRPGNYQLRCLAVDSQGRLTTSHQNFVIEGDSHWNPVAPMWPRPGDHFSAGVRLWADADELAPTGATADVEQTSTLLPVGYFSTAALVEPGSVGYMLFSYRAPAFVPEIPESFRLLWELGVEGRAHDVEAEIKPLPSRVKERVFRRMRVGPGDRYRVVIPDFPHWAVRARLEAGSRKAVLQLQSESLQAQSAELDESQTFWERYGQGADVLVLGGAEVGALEVELVQKELLAGPERYQAGELYLMRGLEDLEGRRVPLDEAEMGSSYLLSHRLVLPQDELSDGALNVPLPGGTKALGAWLREDGELHSLSWMVENGVAEVKLPKLASGEHEIVLMIEAYIGGDYSWPASEVTGPDDAVWASTIDQRLVIERK